jgi:hypothetical protein
MPVYTGSVVEKTGEAIADTRPESTSKHSWQVNYVYRDSEIPRLLLHTRYVAATNTRVGMWQYVA